MELETNLNTIHILIITFGFIAVALINNLDRVESFVKALM